MEIIEQIRSHPLYQKYYDELAKLEEDRVFCRHQMGHFLDVARIAYIHNLERGLGIRKEVIYAAALLHDIGKARQYTEGIPHEKASAEIAAIILRDVLHAGEETLTERISFPRATSQASMLACPFGDCRESELPGSLLQDSSLTEEERQEILRAILGHRKKREGMAVLEELLYVSDKQSRPCFACAAEKMCDWSKEKKNGEVEI